MTKEESATLLVIARLTPDKLFTDDPKLQCMPFACSRMKGHHGIHMLLDPHHPLSDEKLMEVLRGKNVEDTSEKS